MRAVGADMDRDGGREASKGSNPNQSALRNGSACPKAAATASAKEGLSLHICRSEQRSFATLLYPLRHEAEK